MHRWHRGRAARGVLVVGGAALACSLARQSPRDETVHVVLGNAAPRVEEVRVRWGQAGSEGRGGAPAPGPDATWSRELREARFQFDRGRAPRVVTEQIRIPRGEYVVEVEVERGAVPPELVRRRVSVDGSTVTIDVASELGARSGTDGALAREPREGWESDPQTVHR